MYTCVRIPILRGDDGYALAGTGDVVVGMLCHSDGAAGSREQVSRRAGQVRTLARSNWAWSLRAPANAALEERRAVLRGGADDGSHVQGA